MRHTISILVENEFGVLSRIAGMFSGRGFNIENLSVNETLDPSISRITPMRFPLRSGAPSSFDQSPRGKYGMAASVSPSSASHPAITESIAATSYALRAIGPARSCDGPRGTMPERLTSP